MVLSKLVMNPRSPAVRREHRTPYQTHRTIMQAFPIPLPSDERILFRLEPDLRTGLMTLLVQSVHQPDWRWLEEQGTYLAEPVGTKVYDPVFSQGQVLLFRLKANPSVKRDGKRWGLFTEEEQADWLFRKGHGAGFVIDPASLRVSGEGKFSDRVEKENGTHQMTLFVIQYDGILRITDPVALSDAIRCGIGAGKGVGCGLLSVARLPG